MSLSLYMCVCIYIYIYIQIKFNMDDVDDASNRMAFLDMLALSDADIVCAQWKTNGPFCPVHVVARDHTMKWIVVAIRGTLSTKDILTDMAVNHIDFLEGTAHEGFVTAMKRLVNVLKDILQEELRAHSGYRLVLCGHSMGLVDTTVVVYLSHRMHSWL